MVDKRTKVGKAAMAKRENLSSRELAARAALSRFDHSSLSSTLAAKAKKSESESEEDTISSDEERNSDSDDDSVDEIRAHSSGCGCRTCDWSQMFNLLAS